MNLVEVLQVVNPSTTIFLGQKVDDSIFWVNLDRVLKNTRRKMNFDLPVIEIDNGNQCINVVVEGRL